MRTVDEILEALKRLSAEERQEFREKYDRLLKSWPDEQENEPSLGPDQLEARRLAALDSFLALAGTGHSDFDDVSGNKGRHLAAVYAPKSESQ